MEKLLIIFVGGGIGSVARYTLGGWVQGRAASVFPLGTLAVNVLGCAAIGILGAALDGRVLMKPEYRLFLMVGVLGGFTTFSSFAFETLKLAMDGEYFRAAGNVILSNVLGLFVAWLAYVIVRKSLGV